MSQDNARRTALLAVAALLCSVPAVSAQMVSRGTNPPSNGPWLDKTLPPDKRADLLLQQMTLDEKLTLVHQDPGPLAQAHSLGGAGFVAGIPRLGIPDLQMTDGRSGVAHMGSHGRYTTALPSALADAASWDPSVAYEFGALIGKEARDLGFQVSLGGTANIVREPRNGRNYECLGEDPILVGKMLGAELKGTQDQGVIGNINRFAVNDQETGRMVGSAVIDRRAMQETDLLAFEIAIKESDVGTVMCAYNRVNTIYACESSYLLRDVLKRSWDFKGWVMTDWGALHSTVPSALAGLDQEMGEATYFAGPLRDAVERGEVPLARIDDMVHRILRTEFALGVFDNPPVPRPVNPFTGAEVAQHVEEQGIVLLRNVNGQLPLEASAIKSIAVIGSHADVGVVSGGGSDQVDATGGNAVPGTSDAVWHPSSPLKAIQAKAPNAHAWYDSGSDVARAAKLAGASDVTIVFVHQHTKESSDVPSLSLPDNQNELIDRVAAANRHCIVVLESGGPVVMPWVEKATAILEAWYPGIRGGEAIANIIFGDVNPSGKLPVTFPQSEADLPHPTIPGTPIEFLRNGREIPWNMQPTTPFDINYTEGLNVGYRWFDSERKGTLFPFGFGLSYTTFRYSGLHTTWGSELNVSFRVTNAGKRGGAEIAQVYVLLPQASGEPFKRLGAWEKIQLAPRETKAVLLKVNRHYLSIFDAGKQEWELVPGEYTVYVGGSSRSTPLTEIVHMTGGR